MVEEYLKIKVPKNPLVFLTITLGILLVLAVIFLIMGTNPLSNGVLSPNQAGQKAVVFFNSETNNSSIKLQLENVTEISGIYQIYVSYQNQSSPLYSTKDGKYLIYGLIPTN
jgi:hypothetical protein